MRARAAAGSAVLTLLAIVAPTTVSTRAPTGPATCESLAALTLPNTTIFTAQSVPAGPFTPPGGGGSLADLPAFCRVTGSISPSADSDVRFEVWMPSAGWNHKFQGIGNGGFAGSIDFRALGSAVSRGYAAAATDTGHTAGMVAAAWALGHPERITDFGYRAVHETAVKARALVTTLYGGGPEHAYFNSCSNGGRQALMEAQRYPGDYDGIIAGAPANDWTHLLTAAIWDWQIEADPVTRVLAVKLPAIEAATLVACDKLDGVEDGVIDDPRSCRFDPSVLRCKGSETDACLTAGQVDGLTRLYAGPQSASGKTVFPGHQPGGITGGGGWSTWVTGPASGAPSVGAQFGSGFFTNMVLGRPVDPRAFSIDRDMKTADDRLAATLNAVDPDLTRFADRGGKLILYHGWSDPAISARTSIDYYERVVAKMGAKPAGGFLRLFMVPGMQHCSGGPGPDVFGQDGASTGDRRHDLAAALEAWVEHGDAPSQIVATKYKAGTNPASGILRTRPLCPYPQVARWKGTGSTDDAANFTCAAAGKRPGNLAAALSFSVSPIDPSVIEFITPLGNLNPPDHTFPTDHIYFYHHLNHPAAPAYVVVAPAAGTVTSIVQHGDQKVYVQVTSTQAYYLDHLVLDPTIQQATKVTAGQRLGLTSSGAYGIDLGLVNQSVTLGFINPARYASDSVHADAPLKYFAEPLKTTLYGFVSRVGADKDGQVCFDQPGTLAGNWFLDGLSVSQSALYTSGPMEVAFVRDVNDPSQFRISIGGTLAMTGVLNVAAGQPDPAAVTPATGPVAYAVTSSAFGAPGGVILVQMTSADMMRIEAFPGGSPGAVSFTASARTYVR